jgi:hypothetical protein
MTREEKIERIVGHEMNQYVARGKTTMLHHTSELIWQSLVHSTDEEIDEMYNEHFEK